MHVCVCVAYLLGIYLGEKRELKGSEYTSGSVTNRFGKAVGGQPGNPKFESLNSS